MQFVCIIFFVIIFSVTDGQIVNCSERRIKFEKIIGLKPAEVINTFLLHRSKQNEPVTQECLSKCQANEECLGFVLYFNTSECFWYRISVDGFDEHDNVLDPHSAWFIKTCLNAHNCQKSWIFERVSGAILVGNDVKTLPNKVTRRDCQQYCLNEIAFNCKSAKFRISNEPNVPNTVGICTLSDTDRHLKPNSYRVSSFEEEYFENQCSNSTTIEFCDFEEYDNVTLSHTDLRFENISSEDCKAFCNATFSFNCRSYSILPFKIFENRNSINKITCLIHSEDSKVHGPKLLENLTGAKYYEKARCLNITVTCTDKDITVKYQPQVEFYGKMYMYGYSEHLECFAKGNGSEAVTLNMQLFVQQCGIAEAKGVVESLNRTLWSGTMILQHNPLIQTQGDRVVRVGCIFGNDSSVVLGTGVNFTMASSNKGSLTINVSPSLNNPTVEMRIVDFYNKHEVTETQIGQELQLIIEIKPADGPFDIWAGHLVAMTENHQDSVLLLDDRGCPTNIRIFPALKKSHNNETRSLTAHFQAFKFTSSPIIRFSVMVQFCNKLCVPVECPNNIKSYGRRKRENRVHTLDTINGTTVVNIDKDSYKSKGVNGKKIQMPLEFVMIVKKTKISSDRLIYGENNKLLVAGYDVQTNEICLDYFLFIAMIVTWVLLQIAFLICGIGLIRHYKTHYKSENTKQSLKELHKHFGLDYSNLESRRVRWVDDGGYT